MFFQISWNFISPAEYVQTKAFQRDQIATYLVWNLALYIIENVLCGNYFAMHVQNLAKYF